VAGTRLKVLLVSSEAVPFAKTGGLSDVVTALAVSLEKAGVDIRLLMPLYSSIQTGELAELPHKLAVPLGVLQEPARLYQGVLPTSSVPVYFLANDALYRRGGIYGDRNNIPFADNARRFTFLNRGAFEVCRALKWRPDVIHVHDWPTGLIPLYLRRQESAGFLERTASVLTIHNIGYQGTFPKQDLFVTQLAWEELRDSDDEESSSINLLRTGLRFADLLTTVSPTYAREIQTTEYGSRMEGLLRERSDELTGILNGIDYDSWNPENDPLVPHHFSHEELSGKELDKRELQLHCGFAPDPSVPVIGMISRLVDQKGFVELCSPGSGSLYHICTDMAVQFVILGTGEPWCEEELSALQSRLPNLRVYLEFNNKTAHLIEAGSDFFLMPSRYEPCGLNQMYSLRYGTLPIVRRTGGLADTVEQYDEGSGDGTGFLFDDLTPRSIYDVVGWAVWAWYNRREHIQGMRSRAMQRRFSWEKAAGEYLAAYDKAIDRHRSRR